MIAYTYLPTVSGVSSLGKQPTTNALHIELYSGINFYQCGKGRHILYIIINTGQKIVENFSPMTTGGEIGEIVLLVKILAVQYQCQLNDCTRSAYALLIVKVIKAALSMH